jgi:hypothetical protein
MCQFLISEINIPPKCGKIALFITHFLSVNLFHSAASLLAGGIVNESALGEVRRMARSSEYAGLPLMPWLPSVVKKNAYFL